MSAPIPPQTESAREAPARGGSILLIEDNAPFRAAIAKLLSHGGFESTQASTASEAIEAFERHEVDVILLDLGLPDMDGLDLLVRLRQIDDRAVIVVLTGRGDIETVVEAMKRGAENFLVKPVERDTLHETVGRAMERVRLERGHRWAQAERRQRRPGEPVGGSSAMGRVRELAATVAETDASVVLVGESGTGKGMLAQLIHGLSRRAAAPMLDVNCAALPPQFLESELFGHERGAFTDAKERKLGLLEVAHGGTVFLDEIAEMDPLVQSKLLKALEDSRFRRLGGVRDITVDVRLLVATSANLRERLASGHFRQDLYYRLNVFEIEIPPLRDRGEDVIEIAMNFIHRLNPVLSRQVKRLSPQVRDVLLTYPWPGNVRELRNVVERAMILATGEEIALQHLPRDLTASPAATPQGVVTLAESESACIRRAIEAAAGNLKLAAAMLGIARSTLYRKLDEHGIEVPR